MVCFQIVLVSHTPGLGSQSPTTVFISNCPQCVLASGPSVHGPVCHIFVAATGPSQSSLLLKCLVSDSKSALPHFGSYTTRSWQSPSDIWNLQAQKCSLRPEESVKQFVLFCSFSDPFWAKPCCDVKKWLWTLFKTGYLYSSNWCDVTVAFLKPFLKQETYQTCCWRSIRPDEELLPWSELGWNFFFSSLHCFYLFYFFYVYFIWSLQTT